MVETIPRSVRDSTRCDASEKVRLKRRLVISPKAAQDLREIVNYLDDEGRGVAEMFESEAEACLLQIERKPFSAATMGEQRRQSGALRTMVVSKRFWKYRVYYRVFAGSVRVVRVLHGARNVSALLRLKPNDR